jgi:predicted phage tail protein
MATLRISPTFSKFFDTLEYNVDINSYYDIESYLSAVHKDFSIYMKQIQSGISQESFCYLDKDLKVIEQQYFPFKKITSDDIIYIAPIVCGGGGKKGFIFAAIAIVAIGFATGGFGLTAAPGLSPGALGGKVAASSGGFFSSITSAFASMPSFLQGIIGNLALSAIGALFTSKPKQRQTEVTKDSGTRTENNMFGSLSNTTSSGTPIQLNYGTMRISGQFLSGYIVSQQHGQNDSPSVASMFAANQTPLFAEAQGEE